MRVAQITLIVVALTSLLACASEQTETDPAEPVGDSTPNVTPTPEPPCEGFASTPPNCFTAFVRAEQAVDVSAAILSIGLVPDLGFDPIPTPCPPTEEPCPVPSFKEPPPGRIGDADVAPILDAIADQGISRDDITPIWHELEVGDSVEVFVTITDFDRVDAVAQAATEAVVRSDQVALLSDVSLGRLVTEKECIVARQAALDRALADARSQAETAAKGFDVVIGDVLSVDDGGVGEWACSVYTEAEAKKFEFFPLGEYIPGKVPLQEVFVAQRRVDFEIRSR